MLHRSWVLVLALVVGCDEPADDCQRAVERLARIQRAKDLPVSPFARDTFLESCRTSKFAKYDPVLRCLIDSRTDDAASACIDRGMAEVLAPSSAGPTGGQGLNPLLP